VATELHRDGLGDAAPDERADRCPSQIVPSPDFDEMHIAGVISIMIRDVASHQIIETVVDRELSAARAKGAQKAQDVPGERRLRIAWIFNIDSCIWLDLAKDTGQALLIGKGGYRSQMGFA
jgi:hypothetical protein